MGLFNLIFNLSVNSTDFSRGMKTAVQNVDAHSKEMGKHLGDRGPIGGAISQVRSMLLGMVGAGAMTHAIRETVAYASKINDMASATGVSTERLQEMDHALKMTGASMEDGVKAIRKLALAREAALANPEGKQANAFAKFGITTAKLSATSDPSELMLMLGDAVKGVTMDTDSLASMLDLVGARNSAIIPAMVEGWREAGSAAHDLGLIMSEDNIKTLDAAEDSVGKLAKAFSVGLAPAISAVAKWFMGLADSVKIFVNGVVAMIESLKSTGIFTGADFTGNMVKAFEAFDQGAAQTDAEIADQRAAEQANEGRRTIDLEDVATKADTKAAKEAIKDQEKQLRLEEDIHKAKLQQMTPAARLKQLEQDRSDFAIRAFDEAGGGDISLEDEARLARFDADISGLSRSGTRGQARDKSDALTSVGNFLGGGPDPAVEKLRTIQDTLKNIELATKKTADNVIGFV